MLHGLDRLNTGQEPGALIAADNDDCDVAHAELPVPCDDERVLVALGL